MKPCPWHFKDGTMPLTGRPPWRWSLVCLVPSILLTLATSRSQFRGPVVPRKVNIEFEYILADAYYNMIIYGINDNYLEYVIFYNNNLFPVSWAWDLKGTVGRILVGICQEVNFPLDVITILTNRCSRFLALSQCIWNWIQLLNIFLASKWI